MKLPKAIKKYCKYCKKHTEHKVIRAKNKTPGSKHPLSHGSKHRLRLRNQGRGLGNHGRVSRPAVNARKMSGRKQSKKLDLRYSCSVCKKTSVQRKGKRAKKFEIV